MTENDLVASVPLSSAMACGSEHVFDSNKHPTYCPTCGAPERVPVRVHAGIVSPEEPFELFLLRDSK